MWVVSVRSMVRVARFLGVLALALLLWALYLGFVPWTATMRNSEGFAESFEIERTSKVDCGSAVLDSFDRPRRSFNPADDEEALEFLQRGACLDPRRLGRTAALGVGSAVVALVALGLSVVNSRRAERVEDPPAMEPTSA